MILVTGGNGFVGSALVKALADRERAVRSVVRKYENQGVNVETVVGELTTEVGLQDLLSNIDTIVHTAARVHVMKDIAEDPLENYRSLNVTATLKLARQAANRGVRRFVFISSIKVNGESTEKDIPFRADDLPFPTDPYGISKMEAEQELLDIAATTEMEVVIIRPPLIYGPGVKANFKSMMDWLCTGMPLPLGSLHNKRSLIAIDNLIDFIMVAIDHKAAANQIFLVSDGEDLSTTELLRRTSKALGKSVNLLPVPEYALKFITYLLGKKELSRRLCDSLQIDISKNQTMLGWTPPVKIELALKETASHYLTQKTMR